MNKKLAMLAISCLALVLASCGDSSQPEKKLESNAPAKTVSAPVAEKKVNDCQLNMGWDPWEPYQYLTFGDEVKGLEIELVSAIANEAGCELHFVQKNWMMLLNGIRSGSIDLLGGATPTEARENFAYFSDNYRHESFILYVRTGEAQKYEGQTLKQLLDSGLKIGVTQDYIYGDMVTSLYDDEKYKGQFVSVPTTEVNYYNLTQGNVDAFLEDPFVAAYTIKRKGLQDQIEPHSLEVSSGDVRIMFSKKSVTPEIVDNFNQALARLKQSGKYQEILDKYSQ